MIKRFLAIVAIVLTGLFVTSTPTHAQTGTHLTVTLVPPTATYWTAILAIDGPGDIGIPSSYTSVLESGDCSAIMVGSTGAHRSKTKVGYSCTGPASVHVTLPFQQFVCTGDPGVWEPTKTADFRLDGALVFSELYDSRSGECWVTPAAPATVFFAPDTPDVGQAVAIFDNSGQPLRDSAYTKLIVTDAAWNYSQHAFFITDPSVVCGRHLVKVYANRWTWAWREQGFECSGIIPAYATVLVYIDVTP